MPSKEIRWGILGPGRISRQFAEGLKAVPEARLVAVGSRTTEGAAAFAREFSVARQHVGYQALAADPDIDIIYISTPHSSHKENALLCLAHGKAVLCEKPFTINANEAREVVQAARQNSLFVMEAMWTRFFPLMDRVKQILEEGTIGDLIMLQADFGFRGGFNPESRLFNPSLGGGALLDVGVYPISLASMFLGTPDRITGVAALGETCVDELGGMLFGYPQGQIAVLATSIRGNTLQEAVLTGTKGLIRIHSPWWKPQAMTLLAGGKEEIIQVPFQGNGYQYEAIEAMNCLRQGQLESSLMPLEETLSIMETMDELRRQWGVTYPMEK